MDRSLHQAICQALEALGKRKLVLSIHDASFPGSEDEDLGRGTPYSRGGGRLLSFARALGFTGLQLGPPGQTSRGNPSPYDGTVFSRNSLSIATAALAREPEWGGILREEDLDQELERVASGGVGQVRYRAFYDAQLRLLERAYRGFAGAGASGSSGRTGLRRLRRELAEFRGRSWTWLDPDSLYEALIEEHGSEDWRQWPDGAQGGLDQRLFSPAVGEESRVRGRRKSLRRHRADRIAFYTFCQFVAHRQHSALQAAARTLGLELLADLQIGLSLRDMWAHRSLFLPGYALGAPPSRTNPSGQPWGYPVFDPRGYGDGAEGPVVRFVRRRVGKLFDEYDGLRIDHPQGLVCPWVYRLDDPDPMHAVQTGARLFSAPDFPDHPRLAAFAIPRADQLACSGREDTRCVSRHDDAWVRRLEPGQVERYARLVSIIVESAHEHGRASRQIACEILSTLPYPLAGAIQLHGLGRFRVTQKADVTDSRDVYRSDNAEPSDWIMVGTHDTPPIWALVERWLREGRAEDRAGYLSRRLVPAGQARGYRQQLLGDPGQFVHAELADILASRAEQVLVFFADLFGLRETYNTPGSVGPQNWALRVPADYEGSYPPRARRLQALNIPYALSLALASPARGLSAPCGALAARLRAAAFSPDALS
ncbi:MAG: 4-alpha-glucanotransferase [Spirochaetales bacterium]|nr:4-alpha-glucanotransferase [Spirochaetales bacterium]